MPLIKSPAAPIFDLPPFLSVTGLAAPSRGSRETCVWRLALAPGAPAALHSVDREEIFVALTGRARATLGEEVHELGPGDALIVPAGQSFGLGNPHSEPFVAVAVAPVGSRAAYPQGASFAPPWTE
jgi:quercetin dioxygenase-like cupin family protein